MGNRLASNTDGVKTNYLVAGNIAQVLLESDANDVVTADYTDGIDLIRKQSGNREGFYYTDLPNYQEGFRAMRLILSALSVGATCRPDRVY